VEIGPLVVCVEESGETVFKEAGRHVQTMSLEDFTMQVVGWKVVAISLENGKQAEIDVSGTFVGTAGAEEYLKQYKKAFPNTEAWVRPVRKRDKLEKDKKSVEE
jgi:hypothetical protein